MRFSRREFLCTSTAGTCAIALPQCVSARVGRLDRPVRMGLIADLHQDIMHDGEDRLAAFLQHMKSQESDAILQLGDFAVPSDANQNLVDIFNDAHRKPLHVIGNHDTDSGHTKQECLDRWKMPARYYKEDVGGITLLVLDGNDRGSPTYQGGYPSYIGEEQQTWLVEQLSEADSPVIIASHQPLAGNAAIDNAADLQAILGRFADKILLALNGHTHIDQVIRIEHVIYAHINSASYKWVGGDFKHQSYAADVHEKYPTISYTCPYRDPLFAVLTIDPTDLTIQIEGRTSEWVGDSPAQLGENKPNLIDGEEVAPRIRSRRFIRPVSK